MPQAIGTQNNQTSPVFLPIVRRLSLGDHYKEASMEKIALLLLFISSAAGAATPADFFCTEKPLPSSSAVYFDRAVKDCGEGKSTSIEKACSLTVMCKYITKESKDAAQAKYKKPFAALPDEEKLKFINTDTSAGEWMPTVLTCAAPDGPICPTPEECKGDLFFKLQQGYIDTKKQVEMDKRFNSGDMRLFPVQPTTPARPGN